VRRNIKAELSLIPVQLELAQNEAYLELDPTAIARRFMNSCVEKYF
jgi:hypothetical protein